MNLLSSLIETLDITVVAVENDGEECRCSREVAALLGRAPKNQRELIELLSPDEDSTALIDAAIDDARSGREMQLTLPRIAERKLLVELSFVPIGEAERRDVLVIVNCPQFEASVSKRAARKERLAAVGQLSAGMTHELNNILTAILGWTQIALRDPSRVETVDSALSIVDENCRRAKNIIDDMMGFVRDDEAEHGPSQLDGVADDVLRVLSWELNNAGVIVNRAYRATPPAKVARRQLFQVFLNLVLNSLHAMREGGELTVSTRTESGTVQIDFTDTGHGMDAETSAQVFDTLFTTKDGTGLGLAICQRFVHENGGDISVSSEPGKGSTFTVTLPVDESKRTRPPHLSAPEKSVPSGLEILVIENERDVRRMIVEALDLADTSVSSVGTSIEAMAVCRRQSFDVVFIDAHMPGSNGAYLTNKLRELQPQTHIVMVSGRADSENTGKSTADGFLRKPFTIDSLYTFLRPRKDTLPSPGKE